MDATGHRSLVGRSTSPVGMLQSLTSWRRESESEKREMKESEKGSALHPRGLTNTTLRWGTRLGLRLRGEAKKERRKIQFLLFVCFFPCFRKLLRHFFFVLTKSEKDLVVRSRVTRTKGKNLTIGLLSCLSLSPNTAGMHLENFFFFKVSTSCYSIGGQMAPLGIVVATGETARAVLLTLPQKKALPARLLTRSFPHTHRWSNMVCPSTDDRRGKASVEWMASGTGDKRSGEKRRKTSAR